MSEWNDQALVLRRGQFRENDYWLRLLCRNHGLQTIFAFGAAVSKRRFCGCLDVLNSLQCRVKSSRDGNFLNLQEAALLDGPRNLRTDWPKMGLAANCLRFLEALEISRDASRECYAILEDLRLCLEKPSAPPGLTALFFRLRVAGALGFAPDFASCGLCSAPLATGGFFMVEDGRVFCPACFGGKAASGHAVRLPARSLDLLRFVQQSLPSLWHDDFLESGERRACAQTIDMFVQRHIGLIWDNGYFRRV